MLHLVTNDAPRGEHLVVDEFDDLEAVGEAFRAGARVTVDLRCPPDIVRRCIDFMSGLVYALDGTIERADEQVFLLTPAEQAAVASA